MKLTILLTGLLSCACCALGQIYPKYAGELVSASIFGKGFNSGQAAWYGNPQLPGWTSGVWSNPYGQWIFIKAVQTNFWGAGGANGGREIADCSVLVERTSDGNLIDYLGWDSYVPTTEPQRPEHVLPGFIALAPGDSITVSARAFNGLANLSTGEGIFGVGASVAIWYTVAQP